MLPSRMSRPVSEPSRTSAPVRFSSRMSTPRPYRLDLGAGDRVAAIIPLLTPARGIERLTEPEVRRRPGAAGEELGDVA
jgi:hypothetical protein